MKYITPFILQTMAWPPTRLIFAFFAGFRVFGKENLRAVPGNAIFASNHANELDPIIVTAGLPLFSRFFPLFYMSAPAGTYTGKLLPKFLFGGTFFAAWGAYPLRKGTKNYAASLETHVKLLKEGKSLVIFPEGWMTKTGQVGEAHGGVAFLAAETGVPVIPVAIRGTFKANYSGLFSGKQKISVTYGAPLTPAALFPQGTKDLKAEGYKAAAERVMGDVAGML
jgi:1-acyl-sn-glycerol-3-phosphate acyltransferase